MTATVRVSLADTVTYSVLELYSDTDEFLGNVSDVRPRLVAINPCAVGVRHSCEVAAWEDAWHRIMEGLLESPLSSGFFLIYPGKQQMTTQELGPGIPLGDPEGIPGS